MNPLFFFITEPNNFFHFFIKCFVKAIMKDPRRHPSIFFLSCNELDYKILGVFAFLIASSTNLLYVIHQCLHQLKLNSFLLDFIY